jgi:anti-sigma factor RsiW
MRREEASRLLQPYLDGELDAATALELEQHLAVDAQARAMLESLRRLSSAVRANADYHTAPQLLRERITAPPAEIAREKSRSPRIGRLAWVDAMALSVVSAVFGALVTAVVLRPSANEPVERDVVASHVRATLGSHLTDVISSDQHTVKPWLSARLDFSPPVHDLTNQGYELVGARVDYAGSQRVAALVYRRRQHIIDVMIAPSESEQAPRLSEQNGFNLNHFARGGMSYWLVSDLNANELGDLARLLASAGAVRQR